MVPFSLISEPADVISTDITGCVCTSFWRFGAGNGADMMVEMTSRSPKPKMAFLQCSDGVREGIDGDRFVQSPPSLVNPAEVRNGE